MAIRPIFVADPSGPPWVRVVDLAFQWHPGFAPSQAQKSIQALHAAATAAGIGPVLEISSKSPESLGKRLSAFNLELTLPSGERTSVEAAFQGSKQFIDGGPYTELYHASPREAKLDPRIRSGQPLVRFDYMGSTWPLTPPTLFYDWLYLTALTENPALSQDLPAYSAFSDIAFNPARSINCQARSAALYVALARKQLLPGALCSQETFGRVLQVSPRSSTAAQGELF